MTPDLNADDIPQNQNLPESILKSHRFTVIPAKERSPDEIETLRITANLPWAAMGYHQQDTSCRQSS